MSLSKNELNWLASFVSKHEGKKVEVSIGNIREILRILESESFLSVNEIEVAHYLDVQLRAEKIVKKRKKVGCVVRQGRKTSKK